MSAQPIDRPLRRADAAHGVLAPMQLSDIAEVAAIEKTIYSAPWTEGNFVDSLTAGYCAWVLRAAARSSGRSVAKPAELIGYFVLMAGVEEAHLLNVSVASGWQSLGHGLYLLRSATALAVEYRAASLILEVRPSNVRALAVYRRFGFRDHGLRRRYYPASAEDQLSREDALVMRLEL